MKEIQKESLVFERNTGIFESYSKFQARYISL